MEKYLELRENAAKRLHIADHMLTMTYPLANDTRLLLSVLENIFLSFTMAMGSILHYEALYKKVPQFEDNFSSKFQVFREYAEKNGIEKEYVAVMALIKNVLAEHKKSPVEFSRKGDFILCNGDYDMHRISVGDLKSYIKKAKSFLEVANRLTGKGEALASK